MKVDTVNHGNVYGTGSLVTYHCGNCGIEIGADSKTCLYCGEEVIYEGAKNTEQQLQPDNL